MSARHDSVLGGHYVLGPDAKTPVLVDLMKWANSPRLEQAQPGCGWARVAHHQVGDARVSTVFLGLDHSFGGDRPVLFETMVFGLPAGHEMENYQERYCTWDEAEAGHIAVVGRLGLQGGPR